MSVIKNVGILLSLAAVAGCGTIHNAQETQRALEPKGFGPETDGARVCLRDYTLRELVDFAMTNRPSVINAALAVDDAHLALREIVADAPLIGRHPWCAPHLSASGGYSATSEVGGDNGLRWQTEGNASAGLSLSVLLYDFGRNRARAQAQAERVIAAEYALVREGYVVFEEVATSYFSLMERDALLEVALTNEHEYAVHLRQAKERLAAGEAQRLDVTRARLDLSRARETTIAASNLVVTTGATLMRALGIDASRGTRNEVFPPTGEALSVLQRGFADTRYDIGAAFSLARTNAPAVAIARARLRAASRDVDHAIANLLPSVSGQIGLNWVDPIWMWSWGVSAVQSIFEGFRKTTAVDRAVVAMHTAAATVDETEQKLSLDLETAIATRDNAVKAWDTARASLVAARENLDMVKARYLEGDASRVDFTDSVSDYAEALGSRVTAFYNGQIAEARLFALTGRLPEFREESIKED